MDPALGAYLDDPPLTWLLSPYSCRPRMWCPHSSNESSSAPPSFTRNNNLIWFWVCCSAERGGGEGGGATVMVDGGGGGTFRHVIALGWLGYT